MAATKTKRPARKPKAQSKSASTKRTEALEKARAAKASAREERDNEKAAQRKKDIASGDLVVSGDTEFHVVDPGSKSKTTLDDRAVKVVDLLKNSRTPVLAKDVHEQLGGSYALLITIYSTLKALGLVTEYRARTGERGGSGVAYLWNK